MIRAFCTPDGKPNLVSSVNGIAIYLDNWAIKDLSKGDASLRQRFIAALNGGADILFSIAHAVEVIGPLGDSSAAFKAFLDEVGPHWYPTEFLVFRVMEREAAGMPPGQCCLDEELLRAYFVNRTSEHTPDSGKVINLSSEQFFKLGNFVDWLAPHRDYLLTKNAELDSVLLDNMGPLRAKFKRNPAWLDRVMPEQTAAAAAAFSSLMRDLISDAGYQ